MSQTQQASQQTVPLNDKWNEQILVIKREFLFPNGPWNGVKAVDFDWYLKTIQEKKEFTARGPVETNTALQTDNSPSSYAHKHLKEHTPPVGRQQQT